MSDCPFSRKVIVSAGTAARNMGWRWGMWAPGIIGVVVGMLVLAFVRDSPEAIGYPPIEEIEVAKTKNADGSDSEADEEKKSLMTLLVENVLRNPYIWGMVCTDLLSKLTCSVGPYRSPDRSGSCCSCCCCRDPRELSFGHPGVHITTRLAILLLAGQQPRVQ
jgi:hypothetical protein